MRGVVSQQPSTEARLFSPTAESYGVSAQISGLEQLSGRVPWGRGVRFGGCNQNKAKVTGVALPYLVNSNNIATFGGPKREIEVKIKSRLGWERQS